MTTAGQAATFDIVVIGAGINGVAIARDAALRGFKVAIVERDDIGAETSSWSSRMIHGGLRYLEQFDFRLVRESLREREYLFRNGSHLVHPMSLLIPIYDESTRGSFVIKTGMYLYDLLSYGKSVENHSSINAKQLISRVPGLRQDGLKGAISYVDGQVEISERLCVEQALDAIENGADLLLRHDVTRIFRRASADLLTVEANGAEGTTYLNAEVVINAAGPWVDGVLKSAGSVRRIVGGTRGSHIALRRFPGAPQETIHFETEDGKPLLIIPWRGILLVGSTDIPNDGVHRPRISADERRMLVRQVNRMFPAAEIRDSDILFSYCGVRPLPHEQDKSVTLITRRHALDVEPNFGGRLISLVGGKLTTHRQLAEEAVDSASKVIGRGVPGSSTKSARLPGWLAAGEVTTLRDRLARLGCSDVVLDELIGKYGGLSRRIAAYLDTDPSLVERIAGTSLISAEVLNAVRHEYAQDACDVIYRRLAVRYDLVSDEMIDHVEKLGQRYAGWDDQQLADGRERIRTLQQRLAP